MLCDFYLHLACVLVLEILEGRFREVSHYPKWVRQDYLLADLEKGNQAADNQGGNQEVADHLAVDFHQEVADDLVLANPGKAVLILVFGVKEMEAQ
jgi:hypothetical protein